MEERMRFVIRLKDGERMGGLCREFRISRKTGYKILDRYQECGPVGSRIRRCAPHAGATSSARSGGVVRSPDKIQPEMRSAKVRFTEEP
jgi:Helix-turn-helix domain